MTVVTDRRAQSNDSDEARAVTRLILGLTLSTGGMVAASGAAADSAVVLVALPTVLMGGFLLLGATPAAGWCGVAIWLLLMPMVHAEGVVAALAMMAICALVAVGPTRVAAWLDVERPSGARHGDRGWIEEHEVAGRSIDTRSPDVPFGRRRAATAPRPLRSAGWPRPSGRHRRRWSTSCSR